MYQGFNRETIILPNQFYTTGLQAGIVLYAIDRNETIGGIVQAEEIDPVSNNGLVLPCGASGRWESMNRSKESSCITS